MHLSLHIYHPRPAKILQNTGKLMWTLIMILQDQNRRVVLEGVRCFSSDHSLHRCGQSVVQATTLLCNADCVLVNAHWQGLLSSITSCCEFI